MDSKRARSPSFPYLELETALAHASRIFQISKRESLEALSTLELAKMLELSANSGSTQRYTSALIQYGLLDSEGVGPNRKYRLTDLAIDLQGASEGKERRLLEEKAALNPTLIRELFHGTPSIQAWGKNRPKDAVATSILVDKYHFTEEGAKRFCLVYDAAVRAVQYAVHEEVGKSEFFDSAPNEIDKTSLEPKEIPPAADEDLTDGVYSSDFSSGEDDLVEPETHLTFASTEILKVPLHLDEQRINEFILNVSDGDTAVLVAKFNKEGVGKLRQLVDFLEQALSLKA